MGRGRKPSKDLGYRDKKIVERYNATLDTMPLLAKKYGITKQRIHEILMRAKRFGYAVKRQKSAARRHDPHPCEVCNTILQIAEQDDLITRRQLARRLGVEEGVCLRHLNQLKRAGYISKKFATIRSERLVEALRCYRNDSLSPAAAGKKFGYKNFYSILSYQKKKGLNIERIPKSPIAPGPNQEEVTVTFPSASQVEFYGS